MTDLVAGSPPSRTGHRRSLSARLIPLLLASTAVGVYCGYEPAHTPGPEEPQPSGTSTPTADKMPRDLRMVYLQAAQKEAGVAYALTAPTSAHDQTAELVGSSVAQGLALRFAEQGVTLTAQSALSKGTDFQVAAHLDAWRCAKTELPLPAATPQVQQDSQGLAVQYPRGAALTEWYLNGPLGVEQGFTVHSEPSCGSEKPELGFDIKIATTLRVQRVGEGGGTLELWDEKGVRRARYSDLYAVDATGKELPARLEYDAAQKLARLLIDTSGARYPVRVDPLWSREARLVASDGLNNDYFGSSVSISGDTAVIGAVAAIVGRIGKAYVFVRSGGVWTQQAKLTPSDGGANENFGSSVSVWGDTAIVGALHASPSGKANAGKAYVYVRSGTTWTQQTILAPAALVTGDMFGYSVAVAGDTALVGAPGGDPAGKSAAGQAYLFVRSGTTWSLQAVISASDGATLDWFGRAVALSGNTALIAAAEADTVTTSNAGKAYVFVRSGTLWSQQAILKASDGVVDDFFGVSVALDGNTAVIGAPYADPFGIVEAGKAYVFTRSGTVWSQVATLLPTVSNSRSYFGQGIAISGDTIAIGEYNAPILGFSYAGRAHIFVRNSGVWTQSVTLVSPEVAWAAHYGNAVAVSGDTVLVGAEWTDVGTTLAAGTAYVYKAQPLHANGAACGNGGECTSGFCTDGVCCDTVCGWGWDGDCEACSAAKKQTGADGTCGAARATNPCRDAAGSCDVAESCDGIQTTCPADIKVVAGTACRASAGVCDVRESCDGVNAACPEDAKVAAGTRCRAANGSCDVAESCDGAAADCPADAKAAAGTVCRATTGVCDRAEVCNGTTGACPSDTKLPSGTVCRAATAPCDRPEVCTGTSKSCPTDSYLPSGTSCRPAAGACDAEEVCTGTAVSCPADKLRTNTEVCRSAAGICDSAEFCSGTAVDCPIDQYKPVIAVCRTARGICDIAEYCTGGSPACPPDDLLPAGTICRDETGDCDSVEVCSGTRSTCPIDQYQPDGTMCTGGTCKAGMCS